MCTYYLQLKVVSQAWCAVHPEQNGVLLLGAEPKGKPVCPGAGTLIRGPRVNHHTSITGKDISGPSWPTQIKNVIANTSICHKQCYLSSEVPSCRWHQGLFLCLRFNTQGGILETIKCHSWLAFYILFVPPTLWKISNSQTTCQHYCNNSNNNWLMQITPYNCLTLTVGWLKKSLSILLVRLLGII